MQKNEAIFQAVDVLCFRKTAFSTSWEYLPAEKGVGGRDRSIGKVPVVLDEMGQFRRKKSDFGPENGKRRMNDLSIRIKGH